MPAVQTHTFSAPEGPAAWEGWAEHISPFFDLSPRAETDLGRAPAMTTHHFGGMLVAEVDAPAQDLRRSPLKVGRQGFDHIVMQFYRTGRSRVASGTGEAEVDARRLVVFDMARPVDVASDQPVQALSLLLPREMLSARVGGLDGLHGAAIDYESDPVGRLLFDYLTALTRCGDRLAPHHLPGVAEAAAVLSASFLGHGRTDEGGGTPEQRIEIRDFIHRNLARPDLGVELLVETFGLSRPVLYRQFVEEGGIQSYIRERRLLKAMRMLTKSETARPRVSTVAYACGFLDEKIFSRAFKKRFGILPREARSPDARTALASETEDRLLAWVKDLAH